MANALLDWRHVREKKCVRVHLKMLGLCFDILIIGHKLYGMLCLLKELPLQKELQHFMINNVFQHNK